MCPSSHSSEEGRHFLRGGFASPGEPVAFIVLKNPKKMAQAGACANFYSIYPEYQIDLGKVDIFRSLFLPIYQSDG
jgi:hypothetical protein